MFQDQMTFHGMQPQFLPPAGFVFQGPHDDVTDMQQQQPPPPHPLQLPMASPQDFRGHLLGAALQAAKRPVSFPLGMEACEDPNMEDELSDDGSQPGERKKRLNVEQVRTLERNFEMGNKLEPERKMQLARALGLQPRQIAIWFQNKRARWKTKQLERDFDALKRQFDSMRAENDILQAQNKRLQAEVLALKGIEMCEPINLNKETEGSCSNRSENSSDIKLDMSTTPTTDKSIDPQTQSRLFFPASYRPSATSQLLESTSMKPEAPECAPARMEHAVQQDENFCNMFCSTDEQSAFWAWSEQHNFH